MLIGNIRSNQDLQAKKDLQKQLLELEVANEATLQKKMQDRGDKDSEVKTIKEQYKTPAEMRKDRALLEKRVIDNLTDFGFNYTEAGQVTAWLSASNRLADFNSIYKGVKKDVAENYDKSVVTPEFLKNYLDNAFDDLDSNLGKKFSKDITNAPVGAVTSIDDLFAATPSEADIEGLVAVLSNQRARFRNPETLGAIDAVISLLRLYKSLLPDEDIFSNLRIAVGQNDRMKIVKKIMSLLTRAGFISKVEIGELTSVLDDEKVPQQVLNKILNRLLRQLSYFNDAGQIDNFVKIYRDLISLSQTNPNVDTDKITKEVEGKINIIKENIQKKKAESESIILRARDTPDGDAIVDYLVGIVKDIDKKSSSATAVLAENILKSYSEYLLPKEKEILDNTVAKKGLPPSEKKGLTPSFTELRDILISAFLRKKESFPDYDPRPEAEDPRQTEKVYYTPKSGKDRKNKSLRNKEGTLQKGLGVQPALVSRLKKHFKGDEKLLKKVVKTLQDESSSDSDSEAESKELSRHTQATDKVDKQIEGLVGAKGLGFKSTRISAKKVGKGVKLEKEDNPTYRQFGKYVLHIPYLLNNNIANFKYPSLGSIPSIKPVTISDDYKDLLLDTLQTGKLNKKELDRLPQSEIKHFERVAVGAGLVEQLGLKVGSTDEDKADAKRFELLRGEYLAGNNNDKLIKELRQLITKFINSGRLHKTEGLNLLLELSTL